MPDSETMKRIKNKVSLLPLKSGVYIMKNARGEIIYVGKAKALKNRVSQYFTFSKAHTTKVRAMVSRIADFDYIVTDTEFEALVLECNLIKLHRPRYNILLKDDKQYPFVRVSAGEWPKITVARRMADDGARYFGPYSSAGAIRTMLGAASRIFGLPSCKRKFPEDIGKGRPCLNYQIGRCCAPCTGNVTAGQYRAIVEQVVDFLSGDYGKITSVLRERMTAASEALEFETAAKYRDRLRSIESLCAGQKVYAHDGGDRDVVACERSGRAICFAVLYIRGGMLVDKDATLLKCEVDSDESEMFAEFLRQYYVGRANVPKKLIVQYMPEDAEALCRLLSEKNGYKITMVSPVRGNSKKLTDMARANAHETLSQSADRTERAERLMTELQRITGLPSPPSRIESYDISNTGSTETVAAMVVFVDGEPKRSQYRKFKVRTVEGTDDYAAMREVVYRRFARAQEGDERFAELPDLILLDGGAGHVSSVVQMLRSLDIDTPVWGMVKNDKHRTRDLVGENGEVGLSSASPVFPLLGRIQEEVHRSAITFHRERRGKRTMRSALDGIVGVGEVRKKQLLRNLGSLRAVKEADVDTLCRVGGVPTDVAMRIYAKFHDGEEET